MKTSNTRNFKSLVGRIMIGLFLASMIGSIDVAPALARDKHNRTEKRDNERYENRGRGNDRHHRVQRKHVHRTYGYYDHRKRDYYPPPPVIFVPPPPPGISIFFPPIFIHH